MGNFNEIFFKKKKLFLLVAMLMINLVSFSSEGKQVWLEYPSEYATMESIAIESGKSYKEDSWKAIEGNISSNIIGKEAKSGKNYFSILLDKSGNFASGKMLVRLNQELEQGENYSTKIWYKFGTKNLVKRSKGEVDVYVLSQIPSDEEKVEEFIGKLKAEDYTKITLTDQGDDWIIGNLSFVASKTGRAYLLFVPRISEVVSTTENSSEELYFSIEQAKLSAIKESVKIEDAGLNFLGTKYIGNYEKNNGNIGKDEKVHTEILVDNTNFSNWNHENRISVDLTNIGSIDESEIKFFKNNVEETEIDNYEYIIDDGKVEFIIKQLNLNSSYKIIFDTEFTKYQGKSTNTEVSYKIYDNKDNIDENNSKVFNVLTGKRLEDADTGDIFKEHNIVSVENKTACLGESIEENDGWIGNEIEKNNIKMKKLSYGMSQITISATHDGYISGFLKVGDITGYGISYRYEKIFEVEVFEGENKIEVTTPRDIDVMEKMILKYSLNKDDVSSMDEYGDSGETEEYLIEPDKSFNASIIKIDNLGISSEGFMGENLNKGKEKFGYGSLVDYEIKIENIQNLEVRGKTILFQSNMAIPLSSGIKVYSDENKTNELLGIINKVEIKDSKLGLYSIVINKIGPKQIVYLDLKAKLLNELFEEKGNWQFETTLKDGNIQLEDSTTKPITDREYGNNLNDNYNRLTEAKHYKIIADDSYISPPLGDSKILSLGETVIYSNNIEGADDITNDGLTLPVYENKDKPLYDGKYVLAVGMENQIKIKVSGLSWVTLWLNNEKQWKSGEEDRIFKFRANKKSYNYNPEDKTYTVNITPPNKPGVGRILRARVAYNELEVGSPTITASSGETEDYEVVLLPPLEPTLEEVLDNGIKIGDKIYEANNKKISFGENITYNMNVKNIIKSPLYDKSIVYRTNMGTLKKIETENKDVNISFKEISVVGTPEGYKNYEIKFDTVVPEGIIKFSMDIDIDREDKKEWKYKDSFYSDNVLWEEHSHEYLGRNYGIEGKNSPDFLNDVRHYEINSGGKKVCLGEQTVSTDEENGDQFLKLNEGDGVIFPHKVGDETKNILFENGETQLEVNPSHPGYLNIWLKRNGSWEQIITETNGEPLYLNETGSQNIKVRAQNILGREFIIRARYSLDKNEVENPVGVALSGEVEDYTIYGEKLLEVSFDKKQEETPHEELGVDLGEGLIVGKDDNKYSLGEDVQYKIDVKNLSSSEIGNQIVNFITESGEIDLSSLRVFIKNDDLSYREDLENRVELIKSNNRYNINISALKENENIEIRVKSRLTRDYKQENGYNFILKDKLEVAGVIEDECQLSIEDLDYESLFMGSSAYNTIEKRARHNILELNGEQIKLGGTISNDRKLDLYSYLNNLKEQDLQYEDGVNLIKQNEKYILYNRASNKIPVTVSHNGFVSFWFCMDEIDKYGHSRISSNNLTWKKLGSTVKVLKGTNNIPLDLSSFEGWNKEKSRIGIGYSTYTNTKNNYNNTNKAFIRVRYSLTEEGLDKANGIVKSGEVEDYKIDSFISPFEVKFGDIEDLGLKIKDYNSSEYVTKGAGDKLLTIGEEFKRNLSIKNITRDIQKNKELIFRTSKSIYENFEIVSDNKNLNIQIIPTTSTSYVDWRYYKQGHTFREYRIIISQINPQEEIKLKLKLKVDANSIENNGYHWNYNRVFHYIEYDEKVLAESNVEKLNSDEDYEGTSTILKHFSFDGMSLGNLFDGESYGELETGNGNLGEGIRNFKRIDSENKDGKIVPFNALYDGAWQSLRINVSKIGYLKVYTNIDGSWKEIPWYNKINGEDKKIGVNLGDNEIYFKFLNNTEGKIGKLRLRYGARLEDVNSVNSVAATGEVEDYEVKSFYPISSNFLSKEELGVETDVMIGDTNLILGKDDGKWSLGEKIREEILIKNETSSILDVNSMYTKIVKFTSNLGEIDINNCDLLAINNKDENVTDKVSIQGTNGTYYIKIKEMLPNEEIKVKFNYKITKENDKFNLTNRIYIVKDLNEYGNFMEAQSWRTNIDGGEAGWAYPSESKIGLKKQCLDDTGHRGIYTSEKDSLENDGVKFPNSDTLYSDSENIIKLNNISHDGYIQMWIENRGYNYKVFSEPQFIKAGSRSLLLNMPERDVQGNIFYTTAKNQKVKIKYGQIKSQVDAYTGKKYLQSDYRYTERTIFGGMSTGEIEEYVVSVLPALKASFGIYEELGIKSISNPGIILGKNDGNISFGEEVIQEIIVENLSTKNFTSENVKEVIQFITNNGDINLNDSCLEVKLLGTDEDLTDKVNLSGSNGIYEFKLNEIPAKSKISIKFKMKIVRETKVGNDYRTKNTLNIKNRDDIFYQNENLYPVMKFDSCSYSGIRHYKTLEKLYLGDTATYEDQNGRENNYSDNDGIVIEEFSNLQNINSVQKTLFLGKWNKITVNKVSRDGYISFWENGNRLKVRKKEGNTYKDSDILSIKQDETNLVMYVFVPINNRLNPLYNQNFTVRYSIDEEDISSFNKTSKFGEVENYKVALYPLPTELKFIKFEELGVQMENGKIYGLKDGSIGYGEKVRETFTMINKKDFDYDIPGENEDVDSVIFTSNNGKIDINNLQLKATKYDYKTDSNIECTDNIRVEKLSENRCSFILHGIKADEMITISFNYLINNNSGFNLANNIVMQHKGFEIEKTTENHLMNNVDGISTSELDGCHYMTENLENKYAHLGEKVGYKDSSRKETDSTENDGLTIYNIKRYNETEGKLTLFSNEWNKIELKNVSDKGYITLWLDGTSLKIREDYNISRENETKPLEIKKTGENTVYVYVPSSFESSLGNTNHNFRIRYATDRSDLVDNSDVSSLRTLAKDGEAEEYKVRVIPPINAKFLGYEDLGVRIEEGINKGKIFGQDDKEITMDELYQECIEFTNLFERDTKLNNISFSSNIVEAFTDYNVKGFDVEIYKDNIKISDEDYSWYIDSNGISGKNINFKLKMKENEKIKIKLKLKVTSEDRTNWKIKNSLNISNTYQHSTDDVTDYHEVLKRDYESVLTTHYPYYGSDHPHYEYPKNGTRAYMIKQEVIGTDNYSSIGGIINEEKDSYNGIISDNDSFYKESILMTRKQLYNNSNNKIKLTATQDGYVSIWLWKNGLGWYTGTWESYGIQLKTKYNDDLRTWSDENEPFFVKKGEEFEVYLKIPDRWYSGDYRKYYWNDLDHQNESSLYGVLRIKYSLNPNQGLDTATSVIRAGEIEDYKIDNFVTPFKISDIKIHDLGLTDPRTKDIKSYDKNNGTLTYGEYFEYEITLENLSDSPQSKTFLHKNGEDGRRYNVLTGSYDYIKEKYREILSSGDISIMSSNTSYDAKVTINQTTDKDANILVEIGPHQKITFKYLAKITKEGQSDYLEEKISSSENYNKTYYYWFGKDEFWMDRRKVDLSSIVSNRDCLSDSNKNFILKGSGSRGLGNDKLTVRNYGAGEVGRNINIYSETRHYRATDPVNINNIVKIGDNIELNNSLGTKKSIIPENIKENDNIVAFKYDGIVVNHPTDENGCAVLYSGIKNSITITPSHDGYISFFMNSGSNYTYGQPSSDTWKSSDMLRSGIGAATDNDLKQEPIKVIGGQENEITLKIPEFPVSERILRIRYAINAEDINSPTSVARTGEVNDIPFKIKPLETGFKEAIDLGVETNYRDAEGNKRQGIKDGKYLYKEIYKTTFTITNRSKYIAENAKVVLKSNISKYYDNFEKYDGEDFITYEVKDQSGKILKNSNGEGEFEDKILKISIREVNNNYENEIIVPKMMPHEVLTITLAMKIDKEDKINWRILNEIKVNGDIQGRQNLPEMLRDYGNATIDENGYNSRHYILTDNNKQKIQLGNAVDSDNVPDDEDDDGVNFYRKGYLFNNLANEVTIYPTHSGYAKLWINGTNWGDAKELKLLNKDNIIEEVESPVQLEKNDLGNKVYIKAPDLINQRKNLRIRYALDKEDINDLLTVARSGEIEEYDIQFISGLKINFERTIDCGIFVKTPNLEGIITERKIGIEDANLIPGENYNHILKIQNITGIDQKNISFIFKTKIGKPILDGSLPIRLYNYDLGENQVDQTDDMDRKITDREILLENQPESVNIEKLSLISDEGYISYKVTIGKILKDEKLYLEFPNIVMKEDEVNWKLVDQIYVDGIKTDYTEYGMKRDYGSGWIAGNNKKEEEARHYAISVGNHTVGLANKDQLSDILTTDEFIEDRSDKGVTFESDPVDNYYVLYSNLKNAIEITPMFSGYVSIWMNNSDTNGGESKWNLSKDIVKSKRSENLKNVYENYSKVQGIYNYPNSQGTITLNSNLKDYKDKLIIKFPTYDGLEKILRFRYSIDENDILTSGDGILSPLYTAKTGEVEDYRVKMVTGISAKFLTMVDKGIVSDDEDIDYTNVTPSFEEEARREKLRIGKQDGNVSLGEIVDNIVTIENKTPLEQNGFTDEENMMKLVIRNGNLGPTYSENGKEYVDMTKTFIKIVSNSDELSDQDKIFINTLTNWRPQGELSSPTDNKHRLRIRKVSEDTGKQEIVYELILDKILAHETLKIHIREYVNKEKISYGGEENLVNELLFVQKDEYGRDIYAKEQLQGKLPMRRDYSSITSTSETSYNNTARNYGTKIGDYIEGNDTREYMKLGTNFTLEDVSNKTDDRDGIVFKKGSSNEDILYYGFVNKLSLNINSYGYVGMYVLNENTTKIWEELLTSNTQEGITKLVAGDNEGVEHSNVTLVENKADKNNIYIKLPETKFNDYMKFRIRYALNKEDVKTYNCPASSGETEDYNVKIVPGLKVDLLEEFEDEGLLLEDGSTRVGVGDGNLSPTEDVIRKINVTNKTAAEQHDVKINYYTDICEVDKTYFKVLDSKTKAELSRTVNIIEDTSYTGNGKKYILTLDKILGESNKNNTEENSLGEQVQIQIRENIKAEALTGGDSKAEKKWNVTDKVSFVVEYDKTNTSYTTSGIQDESSIEMVRDYGNNLLNSNSKNEFTGARHYLALREGIKLGDNIDYENAPTNELLEDNGVIFLNDSIYNNLANRVELKNPLPYKGYISVWLSNDGTDNDYAKEIIKQVEYPANTTELILNIPQESPYLPNTKGIVNSGYKYLRIRYALHKEDIETPYEFARTGEVEDYKLKVIRGLDVKFDNSGEYQLDGKYKPKDIGFNTDENEINVPGRDDGYIGYKEYIKHKIKITNPVDYVQINKEFRFETNVGTYVEGSLVSSKEGVTFENGIMKISQIDSNEIIYVEFKEQITSEPEDWNLVDKIFVDEEDPTKEELINDRVYSYGFKRDYGNALTNDKTDKDVRHYLSKYDDGSGKKFIQIKALDTDPDINYEKSPTDKKVEDTGVDFIENLEKEKILRNNFVNKVEVNVSHDGYIGASLTIDDSRDALENVLVDNETDKNILSAVKVTKGKNIIYLKTPDIPNTDQILRVRYGLNEDDVTLENKIGTTGEIEDYEVRVVSGLAARFIDSFNKTDSDNEEIESKISGGNLLHDLGIDIDSKGTMAGVNDKNLTIGEKNIKVIEIKNLTSLSQEEPVEIILKNNIETINTNSDHIKLFNKAKDGEIKVEKYPSENLEIVPLAIKNSYSIRIKKIDKSETFYIKLIGTVESEPVATYEKEKKWKALSSLTLESNVVDTIEYNMERDYASILKEGEVSYKGNRYYSAKLNDKQVQLGTNFDNEEEVNDELLENDGLTLRKDIEDENTLVLYNNFDNAIPVTASHNGYLKLWTSKLDKNTWAPILDKLDIYLFNVVEGEKEIIVRVGDILAKGEDQNRLLRAGYSLIQNNISPTGYNQVGEVEDYKIKLVSGFKAEFGELEDLGVPIDNFDGERIGSNDENISLGEYVKQKVIITNLSSLPQENKKIRIKVNVGEIYLDGLESDNLKWIEPKNKIDSITKVPTSIEPGYNEYEVNVHEIDGKETLELTYFMKITKESIEWKEWKLREKICDFTTDLELANLEKDMLRDYGENFIGSYDEYSGVRNYTTKGINKAYLGETVEDGTNDGVILKTKVVGDSKINILHNNFTNKITIKPNHEGYISLWLSEDSDVKNNWDTSTSLNIRKITDEVPSEKEAYVLKVTEKDQDIIFDIKDYIKEKAPLNRILRIRYATNKEDVEKPIGVAKTGEVEDYKIQINSGFSATFEKESTTLEKYAPKDLGVDINGVIYGANDENFVPGEIIEHRIKIVNNNDYVQNNKEIVLNSNLCKYEGEEFTFESVDASDNNISKVEDIVDASLPSTYNTKITIGKIEANSSIILKVKFKVIGETLTEEGKFKIQDRIIYEGYIPKFLEEDIQSERSYVGLMLRDYGENIGNEVESDENIRHYITKDFYLGEKVAEEEKNTTSSDNDGVIFTKDESGKENIIYNGLTNEISIKFNEDPKMITEGYISVYLDEAKNTDWSNAKLLIDKQLVTKNVNVVKLEIPDYMKDGNFENKKLRIRFAGDAEDLSKDYSVTGEIEDYQLKLVSGLDVKFGEKDETSYMLNDLGHISNDGVSIGENDGNVCPTEIVEHTITIENKTNVPQENKRVYFESNIGEILLDKKITLVTPEENGSIASIEKEEGTRKYKINILKIKENSFITLKFKEEIKEENQDDYRLKEKVSVDNTLRAESILDMERDYSNGELIETNKSLHYRAGKIDETRENLYYLGDKYDIEDDYDSSDDADGIVEANGEPLNEGDPIIFTMGIDNTIKVKHSQSGYITLWLTSSNASSSYNWKDSTPLLGLERTFRVEGSGITEIKISKDAFIEDSIISKSAPGLIPLDTRILRIRYAGDEEDITKPDAYARSGETEEYKVNMKNITGTKTSITQDGDDIAEPGERVTYTFNFKNNSSKSTNVILNDDFTRALSPNGHRIADIDENSLEIVTGKSYVSSSIEKDKLILKATNLPSEETIEAKIDIVIRNPLPLLTKDGSKLENSMELIENGVSIKVEDEEPPVLKKGKVELKSIKEFTAYRNDEKIEENQNGRVFILPGDIVKYTIKISNDNKDINAWSTEFEDDISDILNYSDFITGSLEVKDKDEKDIKLYVDNVNRKEIDKENVFPIIDRESKKIKFVIHEIEKSNFATISFKVKIKDKLPEDTVFPKELPNEAGITNGNIIGKQELSPKTEGPVLDSVLKKSKTSKTSNGDRKIQLNEEITYEIKVENLSTSPVKNIVIEDSLAEILKFSKMKSITYNRTDILNSFSNEDKKMNYTITALPEKSIGIIQIKVISNSEIPDEVDENKIVYNTAFIRNDGIKENSSRRDEGLIFDTSTTVLKTCEDENINKKAESGEILTYNLELYNPSVNSKNSLELIDDFKTKTENKSGDIKDISLFEVCDFVENSIELVKDKDDSFSEQNLVYDKKNQRIIGNIKIKGKTKVNVKFKVKVKMPIPNGIDVGDFIKNSATINDNGIINKSEAKIPIDYEIIIKFESRDYTGDNIAETGEEVIYTTTIINPYNRDVKVDVQDLLNQQENHNISLMNDITYFSKYVDNSLTVKGTKDYNKKVEENKNKKIGISGTLQVPPMGLEGKEKVIVEFKIKINEDLPEDLEEKIDKLLNNNNLKEEGVPIENEIKVKEERNSPIILKRIKSSKNSIFRGKIIPDANPPLLQAMIRDKVIKISKRANKDKVSVGDLIAYELEIENQRERGKVPKIYIEDKLPLGFRYVKGSARIYRKNSTGKYMKETIDHTLNGRKMEFFIRKLMEKENLKITYLLRVGVGVSPNMYENIAVVKNDHKPDREEISNTARAVVEVLLDRLFDMSTVIGKVFHDRDEDGWQDDATLYDLKIKTITNKENYINLNEFSIKDNEKDTWEKLESKKGKIGNLQGRTRINKVPRITLRREIKDSSKISDLEISSQNSWIINLNSHKKIEEIKKGVFARGESGGKLKVNRKIIRKENKYYEEINLYNLGIYEEGIPGVKISTVSGLVVTTDKYGRYHIKNVPLESIRGNNYILKVDPITLPRGSKFTTKNPLLRRINHVMTKFNFGVKYKEDK